MNETKEANYKIDGIDSWIHCIRFEKGLPIEQGSVFTGRTKVKYHYHEYIELLYFYDGRAEVWVNGEVTEARGGSLVVISSNMAHDVIPKEPTGYACIKFSPSVLYENEPFMINLKYALPFMSDVKRYFYSKEETADTQIGELVNEIISEWKQMEYGFELAIRSAILKIFRIIIKIHRKNGESGENLKFITPEMKNAIAYIGENYSTVTEKEVADACNFSYNYFSRIFKDTVGKSFRDYILELRVNQAEKMLLSTNLSVTEIAEKTGFSSISHFIVRFKEVKGMTPNSYRKKMVNVKI